MKKIVYVCPFPLVQISGGIKIAYGHVDALIELGFDACIFNPHGRPTWFENNTPLLDKVDVIENENYVLVLPETFNGGVARIVQSSVKGTKILFCQNQYNLFAGIPVAGGLQQFGFEKFLTVSHVAKGFMERVFAPINVDVIPVWVAHDLFKPHKKEMRIAYHPAKLPVSAHLIKSIFQSKYPQYHHLAWDEIINKSEAEVATLLGKAAIFLALSDRESVGLLPLEAMAAGCAVVGFHGYGGLEYASPENGVWLSPDHLEETADAIAALVAQLDAQDPHVARLIANGQKTVQIFSHDETKSALGRIFGTLV